MKKLFAITLSGLIGLSASAQDRAQQETPAGQTSTVTSPASRIFGSGVAGTDSGRPMILSEPNTVYGSGNGGVDKKAMFTLKKGHYIIGTDGGGDKNESHSLFVNPSVNDPDKYVALYIENNVFTNEVGTAQIMLGAPTNSGREIQFAPVTIGHKGNLMDSSSGNAKARVLRISIKPFVLAGEKAIYPYLVRGLNGATNNDLLGMRGADETNMDLRVGSTRNMFQWENNRSNKIVVAGSMLSEYLPPREQNDYEMTNLNGDFGAFYALTRTEENTATTDLGSRTQVEKYAIFMSEAGVFQSSPKDCLLVATPAGRDTLNVRLYAPADRLGFFQKLFGKRGRLDPKSQSKWGSSWNRGSNNNPYNDPAYTN
jgi:hypothetical protein